MEVLFFQPAIGKQYGIISLGLLSLSAYIRKYGHDSRIIVLANRDTDETVEKKIAQFNPRYACISLHWYIHSFEAVKIANAVKRVNPEIQVIAGGHTSTHFNKQILEFSPAIDLIIKGDGEKPLLDLIEKQSFEKIDNASFFRNGEFISKPITYHQISLENFSAASESMDEMIDEWENYLKTVRIRTSAPISSEKKVEEVETRPSEFYLYVGKGCSNNCCFCGTSKTGYSRIFNRGMSLFRPIDEVVEDANKLKDNGVESLFLDFGPFDDETYYNKLFDELSNLEIDLTFLPWNLPSNELIAKIGKSFNNFEVQISPDSGSDRHRKLLSKMGYHRKFYTNNDLEKTVGKINEVGSSRGAQLFLWYICGLPFESQKDYLETLEFSLLMKKRFPNLFKNPQDQLNCVPLRLTPGSPIDLWPEKFKMRKFRFTFSDYYEYCKELETGVITHPLGLEREDLSESDIIKRAVDYKDKVVNS